MQQQLIIGSQSRLQVAKQNCPVIYEKYIASKKKKINSRLETLRYEYKNATSDEEKQKINQEATKLKAELQTYV